MVCWSPFEQRSNARVASLQIDSTKVLDCGVFVLFFTMAPMDHRLEGAVQLCRAIKAVIHGFPELGKMSLCKAIVYFDIA